MDEQGLHYICRQLRFILMIGLIFLVLFIFGLMLGYSFIGGGGNPLDVLNPSMWSQVIGKFTGK